MPKPSWEDQLLKLEYHEDICNAPTNGGDCKCFANLKSFIRTLLREEVEKAFNTIYEGWELDDYNGGLRQSMDEYLKDLDA